MRLLTLKLRRDPITESVRAAPRCSEHLLKFCSVLDHLGAALVHPRADAAEAHGAEQPRLLTVKFP